MPSQKSIDYSFFDTPQIISTLFHPRPEIPGHESKESFSDTIDVMIPVEENVNIGARMHPAGNTQPVLLFFHGNGEIVADYDDTAGLFTRMGINFFIADYRGYGRSSGTPTVSAMMRDCHAIFHYLINWLSSNSYSGPVFVMGRSLGSASAIDLAATYPDRIEGLIIESGFAFILPLLRLIGVDTGVAGISEKNGPENAEKIKRFSKPTLIIHAELDHIIPFSEGQTLFESCPAPQKRLLKIDGANHNNIFYMGGRMYMDAIKKLVSDGVSSYEK